MAAPPPPLIDSHVHLYPASEAASLAWCPPEHPLHGQRSVAEYQQATAAATAAATAPSLAGFVAVEADRTSALDDPDLDLDPLHDPDRDSHHPPGWDAPLREVAFLSRVALGQPRPGEGHAAADARLCLAMIPWAPVPSGPALLERYLERVEAAAGAAWPKVRGFRYLLQDKPHGTMLTDAFVDALKLLGRRGFVFEVAVDQHRRGKRQLDEVAEMIGRAHDGVADDAHKLTFILNHLCKPDLAIYNVASDPGFRAWRTAMYALSKAPRTYVKLSGGFAEMPDALRAQPAAHVFRSVLAWLGVVLATFGPARIMFGSDWPVCTLGGLGDDAWPKWRDVVDKMCWMASLSDEERAMVFGGTARQAYGLG
ncbi:uncharacterized protein UV8b_07271 [Ustilaginoidea virens]|uniref:Amidohydrolase-related domain-containing protein n=1 Tax=Ustilaginoidea virens TaxID=1159556 RepID=A0A8E5HWR5_USTVR|nr:uncharacterized protein UV8b_07271 [Ustilaginoidea virens]QUC23030.1 hypothetical protein UV8b_07271 [Ustilaginoidea virens]